MQRQVPDGGSLAAGYHGLPGQGAGGYAAVSRLLLDGLQAGLPPAAAMSVLSSGGVRYRAAGGWANLGYGTDQPVAAGAGTLFDLASLTKVVVTTPLVLLLRQRRVWDLDDPISRWLPGAPRSAVTIRHCLTHTAGLVWHRPYFELLPDAPALQSAVLAELGGAVRLGSMAARHVLAHRLHRHVGAGLARRRHRGRPAHQLRPSDAAA